MKLEIIKPFGPSIVKVKIPDDIINEMNFLINNDFFLKNSLKMYNQTFTDDNNITLLLPNSMVKHGVKYDDNNEFYSKTKNYEKLMGV